MAARMARLGDLAGPWHRRGHRPAVDLLPAPGQTGGVARRDRRSATDPHRRPRMRVFRDGDRCWSLAARGRGLVVGSIRCRLWRSCGWGIWNDVVNLAAITGD